MFSTFDNGKSYNIYDNNDVIVNDFFINLSHLRDEYDADQCSYLENQIFYLDIQFDSGSKNISDYPIGTKFYLSNNDDTIEVFNKRVISHGKMIHETLDVYSITDEEYGNYIIIVVINAILPQPGIFTTGNGSLALPYIVYIIANFAVHTSGAIAQAIMNEINLLVPACNIMAGKLKAMGTGDLLTTELLLPGTQLSGSGTETSSIGILYNELSTLNVVPGSLTNFIVGIKNETIVQLSCSNISLLTNEQLYTILTKDENASITTVYYALQSEDNYTKSLLTTLGFSNYAALTETIDNQDYEVWRKNKGVGWAI